MIFSKSINQYYKKYFLFFLIGIVSLIVVDIAQLQVPRMIGNLVDELENYRKGIITQEEIFTVLSDIILVLVGISAVIVLGRFLWRFGIMGGSRRVTYELREALFAHALKLSNRFYSERKVGGLMAHFTNDILAVRRAVGPGMIMFVDAVFLGALVFGRMLFLDVRMTLILILPMLLIAITGLTIGNIMRQRFRESQKAFEDLSDVTQESLSGISVIKAFVKETLEIKHFLKKNANARDKNVRFARMAMLMRVITRSVVSLVFVVMIAYGSQLVELTRDASDPFTIGDLVQFISYFNMLVWPMMAISMIINVRSRGRASLERIEKILDEPVEIHDDNPLEIDEIQGDIEFNHLYFQYPDGSDYVLKDVTFKINAGETVGILGRTGSGKTSIVDLLLRLYNLEDNKLLIDGFDIMKLPIKQVREAIGYVPQDGFLFSDTIKNNIALGIDKASPSYEDERIQEMAKLSDVHDNIEDFKEGYDTVIGERGVTLSGGQKQRLSIARALAKEPPILILDDSVSAVDTSTEEKILNNLREIRNDKTTILIAHRISTIKNADKIIVIDDGQVLDIGTHDELYERCEFYHDLVERQRLEDEQEVE
ncbi:MAG: ABC transporter ATP-binding protein [Bacillota bacterium]